MKTLKRHNYLELVKLDKPVFGGYYAVINGDRIKDGLSLDAANELFRIIKNKEK